MRDPLAVALAAAARCSVARAEMYLRIHHEALARAWNAVLPPQTKRG